MIPGMASVACGTLARSADRFCKVVMAMVLCMTSYCGYPSMECRSDDLNCIERALPAIVWVSTCQNRPPCLNQVVDAPGYEVAETSSLYVDCQRINIAHRSDTGSTTALRFARSNDGGSTWYRTDVETGTDLGSYSTIVSRGDEVFISHFDSDVSDIRFSYSSDSGLTWNTSIANDPAQFTLLRSSMAVAGEVWIAYDRDGLRIARSDDRGSSWTRTLADPDTNRGSEPSIAVSGDRLFVAHKDTGASDLIFTRSLNGGQSWESFIVESTGNVGSYPSLVLLGNSLFISYCDTTNARFRLARSDDLGDSWTLSVIDDSANVGNESKMTTDGHGLYVAHRDSTNSILKTARSLDQGLTWQSRILDTGLGLGPNPGIGVSGPGMYVAYEDVANSTLKLSSGTLGTGCFFP